MSGTEDLMLIKKAKRCKSCLDWHKYCNAECCRVVGFDIRSVPSKWKGGTLWLRIRLNFDEVRYYALHGCSYRAGVLKVPVKQFEKKEGRLCVFLDCKKLEGNLCVGHPNDKPMICKNFGPGNIPRGASISDNCYIKILEDVKR